MPHLDPDAVELTNLLFLTNLQFCAVLMVLQSTYLWLLSLAVTC